MKTNMIQTFCDTDLTFCVMIAKEHGFFLRAKKNRRLSVISLLAVPRRLFCFGSLVILDVACGYLWLVSLNINI